MSPGLPVCSPTSWRPSLCVEGQGAAERTGLGFPQGDLPQTHPGPPSCSHTARGPQPPQGHRTVPGGTGEVGVGREGGGQLGSRSWLHSVLPLSGRHIGRLRFSLRAAEWTGSAGRPVPPPPGTEGSTPLPGQEMQAFNGSHRTRPPGTSSCLRSEFAEAISVACSRPSINTWHLTEWLVVRCRERGRWHVLAPPPARPPACSQQHGTYR